jgi:RimJ/RimL family protein N-acetyltransferase
MIVLAGVPVLKTERLTLREPRAVDGEAWIALMTSDRAVHVGGPLDRRGAFRLWCAQWGHWAMRGFGNWAVERRSDGAFLGLVGCWKPEPWPEAEIGWTLTAEAEGHGYAHEAARAARRWAYDVAGWATAVSYIEPANARSIALAERLGCVRDDAAGRVDPDDLVYRHPAPGAAS